jgi:predicted amidohydrolase
MKQGGKSRKVKIGLIQAKVLPKPEENLKKTLALAEEAVKKGAKIICTQELFKSYYFCQKRITRISISRKRFPGQRPTRSKNSRRSMTWS